MHCLFSIDNGKKATAHTHCYVCDKVVMQQPDTNDFDIVSSIPFSDLWVRGKIFEDGSDNIYNYRIFCYVCSIHQGQLPFSIATKLGYNDTSSLALKERIVDNEVAVDIYYRDYVEDRFESTRDDVPANASNDIFGVVRRHKSCDIL